MSDRIAQHLISIGCFRVSLDPPFTYGSGLRGPVYCDNRKALSHPAERELIFNAMKKRVADWGNHWDCVVGIATGGIPFGFALARELGRPFLYVRSSPKRYGKRRILEGDWKSGDRAVLVEDLVNQGTALQKASQALRSEGLRPLACFSLVDYQTSNAQKICREEGVEHVPLTNLDALLEAVGRQWSASEREAIQRWRHDPQSWVR